MMKDFRLWALAALSLLTIPQVASAQDVVESNVEVDFVSHYMWRGTDKGGISIQPSGKVSWQGLSLKLQGSSGFDNADPKEIDLTLGYQYGGFNIGVTDYWTSGSDFDGRDLYFYYDPERSAHQFEGNIGFSCPYFSLQAYTMFWGNDYKYDSPLGKQTASGGKRAYSTYIEARVPFYMGGLDWDLTAGVTPFESAYYPVLYSDLNGFTLYRRQNFYADGAACVSASVRATKNFEFGDMKVPIFAEFHANPYLQKANFLVGLRIIPFN